MVSYFFDKGLHLESYTHGEDLWKLGSLCSLLFTGMTSAYLESCFKSETFVTKYKVVTHLIFGHIIVGTLINVKYLKAIPGFPAQLF